MPIFSPVALFIQQLSSLVAWQLTPLRSLAERLLPLFAPTEGQPLTSEILTSRICFLATRKSFCSKKSAQCFMDSGLAA